MQTRNVNKFLESIILWDICKWQGTSLVSEWPPYPIGHNTDPSLMLVTTFMCPRLTVTEKFLDLHLDDLHWESPWYSSIYWCWVTSMSTCVHPLIVKLFNYTLDLESGDHHTPSHQPYGYYFNQILKVKKSWITVYIIRQIGLCVSIKYL